MTYFPQTGAGSIAQFPRAANAAVAMDFEPDGERGDDHAARRTGVDGSHGA